MGERGTEFEDGARKHEHAPAPARAARPETILVVDDEPDIVDMLVEYFSGLGFRVMAAADGAEAIRRAEQGPDIILLDVGMPKLDGYSVCRRLREHLSCPIVFLTARGRRRCARRL
ncbi:MAG: response regulator [Eggerthellaceae bacterium]